MTAVTDVTDTLLHMDVRLKRKNFNLDVTLQAGSGVTVLFGRSGAGKSTIVSMLAGLLTPDAGTIRIQNKTVFESAQGLNLSPQQRTVGYVFQDPRLFPHLTVAKNLSYGLNRLPLAKRSDTFAHVVDLLGLEALLGRRPHSLSGGEKQRTAIGRALLSNPSLLLMDEPLANLDGPRKEEILPYIEQLSSAFAIPVVYVSHAVEEVVRLADTLVLVDQGTVVASGRVEDIFGRLDLSPLTGRYEAGAVLNLSVDKHDHELGLTHLTVQGHTLYTPKVDISVGQQVRLRLRARDVAVALSAPPNTSILNQLPVLIKDVDFTDGPHVELALTIQSQNEPSPAKAQIVRARITKKSFQDLNLKIGTSAHALIKAVAIDRHSLGRFDTKKPNAK